MPLKKIHIFLMFSDLITVEIFCIYCCIRSLFTIFAKLLEECIGLFGEIINAIWNIFKLGVVLCFQDIKEIVLSLKLESFDGDNSPRLRGYNGDMFRLILPSQYHYVRESLLLFYNFVYFCRQMFFDLFKLVSAKLALHYRLNRMEVDLQFDLFAVVVKQFNILFSLLNNKFILLCNFLKSQKVYLLE